jgi:hypothetical protein
MKRLFWYPKRKLDAPTSICRSHARLLRCLPLASCAACFNTIECRDQSLHVTLTSTSASTGTQSSECSFASSAT